MKELTLVVALAFLAGCASTPPADVLADISPDDAYAHIPDPSYSSVVAGFTPRRPVEPGSWRQLNENSGDGAGS
ncbi:hypothetical protein AAFN47_18900 [Hoeflea sp. CAU 1731]